MWPHITFEMGPAQGQLHLYGLMLGCGLVTLFLGVDFAARRQRRKPELIGSFHYCLLAAFLGGVLSAVLLTKLLYSSRTPWGTMAAMPGILGGAAAMFGTAHWLKLPLRDWLPIALPYFCFAHAWGRLGCFLAGCCHGQPTASFLGVEFPEDSMACAVHGHVPVHPTQLYELALLVILGAALLFAIRPERRLSVYLLAYGLGRFGIEFLRGDDRGSLAIIPGLSPSQHLCLLFITAGAWLAWRGTARRETQST